MNATSKEYVKYVETLGDKWPQGTYKILEDKAEQKDAEIQTTQRLLKTYL